MHEKITTTVAALAEVRRAHEEGRRADLRGADLREANLRNADLWGADLRGASLRGASLRKADLRGANLRGANLWEANLWEANLRNADLRGADLRGADLRGANLRGANLRYTDGGVLYIPGLPSGDLYMAPTPDGWQLVVGCWPHVNKVATLDDLAALCDAPDEDWPEARGDERKRREPILRAAHALCVAHADYHAHLIGELAATWGTDKEAS